MPIMIDGDVMR